ncbi:trithorax group protein osa [Drosophila yakuba]|uniref:Uncharacterized protein, isoform A n=2 Tax=Drosophila yakuba TaxID=7245 RepID=B4Q2T5_DROYA|nr:trithorax group protein osa [Drosophila yakuba]EDX01679.1 uncharacterized protein Dyak_GE16112, isoform A [Drosophila yakuba]
MMLLRLTLLTACCFCAAQAVVHGKDVKRREAGFDTYGPPPRPAPQYGPPPQQQHVPHREYGVPQQIPFREYGPPAIKYGPPKLNFLGGGGGGGGGGSSLHEQIKTHFGVPKPFYGPPHIQHKPAPQYGPPPPKPAPQYGPPPQPAPQYGPPPPKPAPQYGPPPPQYGPPPPPLKIQHRPAPQYGPPKLQYGPPPPPPQLLPSPHAAPLFKPAHQPATSYGPPASGPLNLPPKQIFDAPPPNYGPPPLPVALPGNGNGPATTIILTGGHSRPSGPSGPGPVKQVQIQIDSSGHTHSVSGSQAPFHTACDGWKPIPAPVGAYVEQNHIETQGGYSQVAQGHVGSTFGTQYSLGVGATGSGSGGSIIDGLTDEQLVAVALQGGGDGANVITGPGGNSIEAEALQAAIGSLDDSYSKPPSDSFAPGSVHAQKYQTIGHSGPPPPPPSGNYGPPPPPPSGNYGPPPPPPSGNYGPPPPSGIYGPPPPPPSGNYGPPPPQFAALTSSSSSHAHSQSQSNVNIQYGPPSGNPQPFPQHGAGQPNKPVAYRPPVPAGLLESIGATVQHLDQFGVKPQQQPQTYIPPAANEIPVSGSAPQPLPSPQALYQPPPPPPPPSAPQLSLQQQLPAPQPGPVFIHQKQFGPPGPPPPPEPQYLPPPPPPVANVRPLGPPPPPPTQQYLPAAPSGPLFYQQQQQQQQHHHSENSYSASQFHSQGLPLPQQAPRFNLQQVQQVQQQQPIIVHDCGHGPNLVSSNGYQVQQQQQQQLQLVQQQQQQHFGSVSAASAGAYNAISQSIPVAEQHTQQLVTGPADSYGPPPSGNDLDYDHTGYASQKNAVAALPDGTDPHQLPGLDGLDVLSAQKSQSIQLNGQQPTQNFQVQFGGSLNNAPGVAHGDANHEEILSQGLLQSILTAIEQPSQQQQQQQNLPQNHKAQSRSDEHDHEHENDQDLANADENDEEQEQSISSSNRVEVRVLPENPDNEEETPAEVKEIEPIVVNEEEAKH